VVSFLVNNRADQRLDWGQTLEAQVTVVSSISGRPMAGIQVIWRSPELGEVTSVTNFYGVARVSFKPKIPGEVQLTATAGDALFSESVTLDFTLNEPRKIVELIEVAGTEQEPARVRVKVVSSRTGEPLPSVRVMWELNDSRLPSGVTDADGFAWLGFILSVELENTVVAMVEGGKSGWDMAVLGLNQVVVPVIDSLACDRNHSYTGYNVTARALVLDSVGGKPLQGIRVNWNFAGQELPGPTSDVSGIARITFETRDAGEFDLVASLASGLPGPQIQRISVERLPTVLLRGIYAVPAVVRVGRPSDIKVQVVKGLTTPVAGILVRWMVNGNSVKQIYSNEEGWAEFRYVSTMVGDIAIVAAVDNPEGTVTVSTTVRVTAT
jgi:hypothetical protein